MTRISDPPETVFRCDECIATAVSARRIALPTYRLKCAGSSGDASM